MIRAITVNEINIHSEKASILIIEDIKENEVETLKVAIENFKVQNTNNRVLFYVIDDNSYVLDFANEANCEVFTDLFEIQQEISYLLKENVGTYVTRECLIERQSNTELLLKKAREVLSNDKVEHKELIGNLANLVEELSNSMNDMKEQLGSTDNKNTDEKKELLITLHKQKVMFDSLKSKFESKVSDVNELESTLSIKEKNIANLENKLKTLEKQLEDTDENKKYLAEYKEKHQNEVDTVKNEYLQARNELLTDVSKMVSGYKSVITLLGNKVLENKIKVADLEKSIEEKQSLLNENSEEIKELEKIIEDLKSKETDSESLIAEAVKLEVEKYNTVVIEKAALEGEKRVLKSELEAVRFNYNQLINGGVSLEKTKALQENNDMLNDMIKTLREQISNLKLELDKTIREKAFNDKIKSDLEVKVESLNRSLKTMTDGIINGGTSELPPCDYSGKGLIIPVTGSGSHGITTTAMSLANKLAMNSKVLYIDFDLVLPTADSWFKKNPIIKNAPGYEPSNLKYTGLGLFIEKQSEYFTHNASTLIQRVKESKDGYLDYLSGVYTKPDSVKLISANYSSFFNYCGNSYNYVIIDCGRFGSSEINDQIIKLITTIAYKTVVVTTPDKFEIRTFRLKLNEHRIDLSNVCWLVNMCKNTSMDKTTRDYISPASIGMVPECFDIFGEKELFNSQRITRDKFNVFINTIFDTKAVK